MNKPADTRAPRSYVIRIYRRTRRGMVGQVEDVQSGLIRPFRSAAELWRALGGRCDDPPTE